MYNCPPCPEKNKKRIALLKYLGAKPGRNVKEIMKRFGWGRIQVVDLLSEFSANGKVCSTRDGLSYRYYPARLAWKIGILNSPKIDALWRITPNPPSTRLTYY